MINNYNNFIIKCFDKIIYPDVYSKMIQTVNYEITNQLQENISVIVIAYSSSYKFFITLLCLIDLKIPFCIIDFNNPISVIKYKLDYLNPFIIFYFDDTNINNFSSDINRYKIILKITKGNKNKLNVVKNNVGKNIYMYYIFTSGTTNKPKLIKTKYSSINNFINYVSKNNDFNATNKVYGLTSHCEHDIFIRNLLLPIITNSTLIIPRNTKDFLKPNYFYNWIINNKLNQIFIVPSMINLYFNNIISNKSTEIQTIHIGGEPLNSCNELIDIFGNKINIIFTYGATETPQIVTYNKISMKNKFSTLSVGKCIDGWKIKIMDGDKEVDVNKIGEIVIFSEYLGVYHGQEAEKYVYRTGDKGFINEKNNLYIVGRTLFKYNGERIDMSLYKKLLLALDFIEFCIIKPFNYYLTQKEELCLFLKVKNGKEINYGEIYKQFKNMYIPIWVVIIDDIKYLPNGKINYKVLPKPTNLNLLLNKLPITNNLKELIEIVLLCNNIDNNENILDYGINSMQIVQITVLISIKFGVDINPEQVYEYNTINKLNKLIERLQNDIKVKSEYYDFFENDTTKSQKEYLICAFKGNALKLGEVNIENIAKTLEIDLIYFNDKTRKRYINIYSKIKDIIISKSIGYKYIVAIGNSGGASGTLLFNHYFNSLICAGIKLNHQNFEVINKSLNNLKINGNKTKIYIGGKEDIIRLGKYNKQVSKYTENNPFKNGHGFNSYFKDNKILNNHVKTYFSTLDFTDNNYVSNWLRSWKADYKILPNNQNIDYLIMSPMRTGTSWLSKNIISTNKNCFVGISYFNNLLHHTNNNNKRGDIYYFDSNKITNIICVIRPIIDNYISGYLYFIHNKNYPWYIKGDLNTLKENKIRQNFELFLKNKYNFLNYNFTIDRLLEKYPKLDINNYDTTRGFLHQKINNTNIYIINQKSLDIEIKNIDGLQNIISSSFKNKNEYKNIQEMLKKCNFKITDKYKLY